MENDQRLILWADGRILPGLVLLTTKQKNFKKKERGDESETKSGIYDSVKDERTRRFTGTTHGLGRPVRTSSSRVSPHLITSRVSEETTTRSPLVSGHTS